MFSPIDTVAFNLACTFAVSEIASFGAAVNWDQAKTSFDGHLKAVIKSKWLEGQAEAVVNAVLDACAAVCQDKDDVTGIIQAAHAGDVAAAIANLKKLAAKTLPANGVLTPMLQQLLAA